MNAAFLLLLRVTVFEGSDCISAHGVNHRLHIEINNMVMVVIWIRDIFRSMNE